MNEIEELEKLCSSIWKNEDNNYQKVLKILLNNIPSSNQEDEVNDNHVTKIQCVKDFIFDEEVQKVFDKIDNSLMDMNIFEITGMGKQEIKHSNVLSWLLGHNNHELHNEILDDFLLKASNKSPDIIKEIIQKYIFLAEKKRTINIYREQDNIDLVIEDTGNKIVIVIENKIDAKENDGQLNRYEGKIKNKYKGYEKIFIFFTKNGDESTTGNEEKWIPMCYKELADIVSETLKKKIELSEKTKLILESYVDFLEREGIVKNQTISNLPDKWLEKHSKALLILNEYQPDLLLEISNFIRTLVKNKGLLLQDNSAGKNIVFYKDNMKNKFLKYQIRVDNEGMPLKLIMGKVEDCNRDYCNDLYEKLNGNGHKKLETWKWVGMFKENLWEDSLPEELTDIEKNKIEKKFNKSIKKIDNMIGDKLENYPEFSKKC